MAAATPERPSHIVAVSSTGHRNESGLDFEDLNFEKSTYNVGTAYGNSRLANVYFANHLTRLYESQHLIGLSLHPGSIATPLRRHIEDSDMVRKILADPEYQAQLKSVQQGAATSVWAAVGREWVRRGGVYLEDVVEAGSVKEDGLMWRPGHPLAAFRPEDEKRLWELSEMWYGV